MTRLLGYLAVSAALALAGLLGSASVGLTTFKPGDVIASDQVNENFQNIAAALDLKQATITGSCPAGSSIRVVHPDGTVACETDDTSGPGTDYTAGTGLDLVLNEFALTPGYRLPQGCSDGQRTAVKARRWICVDAPGASGLDTVATNATLTGNGTGGDPLSVAAPLTLDAGAAAAPTVWAKQRSSSAAVRGEHSSGTIGWLGFADYGVLGKHSSGTLGRLGSADFGAYGSYPLNNSYGYLGGDDTGAYGESDFQAGRGVYGYAGHTSGVNAGVVGNSASSAGIGVRGIAGASSGTTFGVYAEDSSPDGYAVYGYDNATGAYGYLAGGGGWGAYGSNGAQTAAGVLGSVDAGVLGLGGQGVEAGHFNGDVGIEGDLVVTGTISPPSSRALKKDFGVVDTQAVLQKLGSLPISSWVYRSDGGGARHMGPMAEDFYAAFGLGQSDARISTVDADGVALAGVQALYQELQAKDAEIAALAARLDALERALDARP